MISGSYLLLNHFLSVCHSGIILDILLPSSCVLTEAIEFSSSSCCVTLVILLRERQFCIYFQWTIILVPSCLPEAADSGTLFQNPLMRYVMILFTSQPLASGIAAAGRPRAILSIVCGQEHRQPPTADPRPLAIARGNLLLKMRATARLKAVQMSIQLSQATAELHSDRPAWFSLGPTPTPHFYWPVSWPA